MRSSGRAAVAMMRMIGCNNGRYARNFLHSDCVIDEKTVVLQKKDNEGFGFVLRGAKGRRRTRTPSDCSFLPPTNPLFCVRVVPLPSTVCLHQ